MKQNRPVILAALIVSAASFLFATASAAPIFVDVVLADTPSAYYRLGEGSDAGVPDSSPNDFDAGISGAIAFGQTTNPPAPAGLGTTAVFNGADTFVTPPDGPFGNPAAPQYSLSVEAWFKTTDSGVILGQGGGSASPGGGWRDDAAAHRS